jgi:biotin carboxyl carrier protein
MKRTVLVGEREIEIQIPGDEDILEVEPGVYSILHEGRSYEARLARDGGGWLVELAGATFAAEIFDPRERRPGVKSSAGAGRQSVKAPMPGKVVRTFVAEGDMVEQNQDLAVVEAMKMQNAMKSPKAGKVVHFRVRIGDTVGAGTEVAVIE